MPRTLVLFTSLFPYGTGEEFLESEIGHLASVFDHVLVVPFKTAASSRPLPKNATVDTGLAEACNLADYRQVLDGLAQVFRQKEFFAEILLRPRSVASLPTLKLYVSELLKAKRVEQWVGNFRRDFDDIQHVLFYSYWLGPAALGLSLAAANSKLRFVSRAHGADLYDDRHPAKYLPYRKAILQKVEAIYCVSKHGRDYLRERHPSHRGKIDVSRLGSSDPGRLTRPSDDGIMRVVSCSYLTRVKRVFLMIDGIREAALRQPTRRMKWTHIGNGPLQGELESYATTSLPPTVEWRFAGHLSNSAVLDYYRENPVDIFLNTSESEGIPVSIMEAQSAGIPVVAPAVGGVPEIVSNRNGVLLPRDPRPSDVAAAIETVSDESVARKLKEASRQCWSNDYDAEANYSSFARRLLAMTSGTDYPADENDSERW